MQISMRRWARLGPRRCAAPICKIGRRREIIAGELLERRWRCAALVCVISGLALACAGAREPPILGEPITVAQSGATHRTSIVVAPNGELLVAWRAVFDGNIRDIVVARSADGGTTFAEPVRVHEDGWHIDGCPHAGPSLAVAPDGTVHIAWYTGAEGGPAWYTGAEGGPGVYHAVSRDGARTFEPPTSLLDGGPLPVSRVRLAATAGGRVLAAWDDARTDPARPAVAWIYDGKVSADTLTTGGLFPVVAAAGEHRAAVWLAGDAVRVRTIR